MVKDTDADDGLAIFQAIVSLDDGCIADAAAWHDALHKDILRDVDMLVACHLGYRGQDLKGGLR